MLYQVASKIRRGFYGVFPPEDPAGRMILEDLTVNGILRAGTIFASIVVSTPSLILSTAASAILGSSGAYIRWCTGSPEGAIVAPVGSLALRLDGGAGTTLYVKESGAGNTGWVGK